MIPIGGRPFIDYVVSYISRHGIKNIMMLLSDADSEVFRNHLDDGSRFGVNIGYSTTPRLGTAAALKEASGHVDGTFVVYYGDVFTDLDLSEMIRYHKSKGAICTIALSTGLKIDYGVGRVDRDGRIEYFAEKPILPEYPVSIGVYVCEPWFLPYLSAGNDLAADVLPQLIAKKEKVYGFLTKERHYASAHSNSWTKRKTFLNPKKAERNNRHSADRSSLGLVFHDHPCLLHLFPNSIGQGIFALRAELIPKTGQQTD